MVRRQECMGSGALDMKAMEMKAIYDGLTIEDLTTAAMALQEACTFLDLQKKAPENVDSGDAILLSAMLIQFGRNSVPEAEIQIKTRESGVAAETWRFFKNRVIT